MLQKENKLEPQLGKLKRIAFVVTSKVTAESFVIELASHIAGKGHEVYLIADGLPLEATRIGRGSLNQVPVAIERDPKPMADIRSLFNLWVQLRKIRPQILIYATPKASLLGSIAGFGLRVPVRIYQLWGLRLETTGGVFRLILSAMEFTTSLLSTEVLANSKSLAKKYANFRLNAGKKVRVLGKGSSHGVDISYFDKESSAITKRDSEISAFSRSGNGLMVGFVGRLHPDKGLDTLLEAAIELKRRGKQIKILAIGTDEGADLTASYALGGDFIKIGQVADVRPYYLMMDVLVLPSRREGFPNVVLEAAAMTVPAIVSDGTGVIDSVIDGVTGIVVPVGNHLKLADALELLGDSPEVRAEYGKAARINVEENFAKEIVWKKLLNFVTNDLN